MSKDDLYDEWVASAPEEFRDDIVAFRFKEEVQSFISDSVVGRFIVAQADSVYAESIETIMVTSPDSQQHQDALLKGRAVRMLLEWLQETIVVGMEAEQQLRSEEEDRDG